MTDQASRCRGMQTDPPASPTGPFEETAEPLWRWPKSLAIAMAVARHSAGDHHKHTDVPRARLFVLSQPIITNRPRAGQSRNLLSASRIETINHTMLGAARHSERVGACTCGSRRGFWCGGGACAATAVRGCRCCLPPQPGPSLGARRHGPSSFGSWYQVGGFRRLARPEVLWEKLKVRGPEIRRLPRCLGTLGRQPPDQQGRATRFG